MARDFKYIDKSIVTKIDDINRFHAGPNMVLVKPVLNTEVAGKHVEISLDTFFEPVEYARRIVEVIRTPHMLRFAGVDGCPLNDHRALDWHTEMELHEGELAWVDPVSVINSSDDLDSCCYLCNDELYFAIRYDKFIATRGNGCFKMVNGYILIEKGYTKADSLFIVPDINTHCIVAYAGKPNKSYSNPAYHDGIDVEVGDHIENPKNFIPLEGKLHREFDGDREFFYIQRRHVLLNYKTYATERITPTNR